MRTLSILLFLAGLGLVLAAALKQSGLTFFTGQATITDNSFTTDPCFLNSDTGFLNATAEAADTGSDGFELDPANAFADGGGYAGNINGEGDRHRFYGYGISIDSTCAISGFQVRLDWWVDSVQGENIMEVELSWDGGASWTAPRQDAVETTTEHTAVLGGSVDTWGRAWLVSELSDANFRVRVTSVNDTQPSRDFFLDWVPVKVYYDP